MLVEAELPDDPALLRAMLAAAEARISERDQRIADLEGAGTDARAEIERLQAIIAAFQRHRFGARSEQFDPDQLALALEELDAAVARVRAGLDATGDKTRAPRARDTNRGRLPAHLERVEQVIDLESKACACCGGALHVIGEEVAERLDVVPTTFRVLVTRRPRYGCRACEAAPVQAPAPARVVEGGMPTEALIAHVLVAKYADHLPLYRQAQIYDRQGVTLDRSTLADWVGRAAWWLTPLRDHLLADLKRSPKLFADETTAPVLDPGRGRTKTGQLWAYVRDDRPWGGADPPAVAYVYAPDRKGERPTEHLRGFAGVLQVDGYAGYRALGRSNQVQLAFCWSHVRRGFYEIAASRPAAAEALVRIAQFYAIEQEIRGRAPDERYAARQERSAPLVASLCRFLETSLARASGKGKLAEAIRYALNRWDGLCRFLDDGRVEIDSNTVERSIRPLALNRKNALFAGSDQGGDHWAVIASLVETCKLNRIDPQAWLSATLTRLVAGHPASALDQLMPWTSAPDVA
ncbi:IS66 family transposase [Sphingomonas bacterium]|uniref:IS66 family transposase n=1 Tax=Sphingomonas bacterium TaxID=1895847 RepID=UPI0015756967|nr:IS66 family transposase [Sphingomonas bacterium]